MKKILLILSIILGLTYIGFCDDQYKMIINPTTGELDMVQDLSNFSGGGGDSLWESDITSVSLNATESGKTVVVPDIEPEIDQDGNIGSETKRFNNGWIKNLTINEAIYFDNDINFVGDMNVEGNITASENMYCKGLYFTDSGINAYLQTKNQEGTVYINDDCQINSLTVTGITALDTATVTDEVYGSSWNGKTEVPTKNAVYDKIESLGSDNHNDLSGLQGGSANEYYHLNSSEYTELNGWLDDVTLSDGGNLSTNGTIETQSDLTVGNVIYVNGNTDKLNNADSEHFWVNKDWNGTTDETTNVLLHIDGADNMTRVYTDMTVSGDVNVTGTDGTTLSIGIDLTTDGTNLYWKGEKLNA